MILYYDLAWYVIASLDHTALRAEDRRCRRAAMGRADEHGEATQTPANFDGSSSSSSSRSSSSS